MIKKIINTIILIAILAGLIVAGYFYWQHGKYYPSTKDAYVQANVVHISPQVSGRVSKVFVTHNQYVKQGQPLFNIDPSQFKIAVNKAQANLDNTLQEIKALRAEVESAKAVLAERQAELVNIVKSTQRTMTLVKQRLYPVASGDKATSQLKVAEAAVKAAQSNLEEVKQKLGKPGKLNAKILAAQASLAQAKLELQYTHVVAPGDGYITKLTLRRGSEVSAYQELFSLIENKVWWVNANFRETDLDRIKIGQTVIVKVDMYPDHAFKGIVKSISRGSGAAFSLLPPENATGNWVKVTQRFTVRIEITNLNPKYPLRMGASAKVIINTR